MAGRGKLTAHPTPDELNAQHPVRKSEFYPFSKKALELMHRDGTLWAYWYVHQKRYERLKLQAKRARRFQRWWWRALYAIGYLFTGRRVNPDGTVREPGGPGNTSQPQDEPGPGDQESIPANDEAGAPASRGAAEESPPEVERTA